MLNPPHIPDLRTYAYHQKAAEILKKEPGRLIEIYEILEHWRTLSGSQAEGWAEKWQGLIRDLSASQVADLICKKSEEMDFNRKSSPFACLLSDEERLEILHRFKYEHK
ncbi:hypothetical protein [Marinibactrum halimedae]|uniref:Uncharacterized protein n=1 Tax=Marinibactrum halimedae TaxID=1444977 RepID=A0AA37TBE8_9GAMM|nr:hypothetical protein [Marinibactrum halimedae]MCD9458613.1 hypothetical protein [Marinibactrum halimedae]GLS26022.1 hypothetical protein GCM10007877_17370 [Marinibactrum halimedae]